MKKKKITKSFSNLAEYRNRFTTFGDVKPSTVEPSTVKSFNGTDDEPLSAEKFIKMCVLPTKLLCDMDGVKLDVKSYCENVLPKYDSNTEMLNDVLKLCKKYGLF